MKTWAKVTLWIVGFLIIVGIAGGFSIKVIDFSSIWIVFILVFLLLAVILFALLILFFWIVSK